MSFRTHVPDASDIAAYLTLLEKKAPRPLTIDDMVRLLDVESYDRRALKIALEAQVAQRRLRRIGKTRYQWLRDVDRPAPRQGTTTGRRSRSARGTPTIEGRFVRTRSGFSFVEVAARHAQQFNRDILIPPGCDNGALHGDQVEVETTRRDVRSRRWVGQVRRVITALEREIVGTLAHDRFGWVLLPESDLLPPVRILGETRPQAEQEGLVARLRLTRGPSAEREAGGELVEVLGTIDDPQVQFLIITNEYGLRTELPEAVLDEVKSLPVDPRQIDYEGRDDLRHLPFVTIDGETARDFDDAVCVDSFAKGGWRLWVAIADVAHYVQPGSDLDKEALRRGNSVYFPDRAIPMLPHQLSTTLCSLNPQRDRLVQFAEMHYDAAGNRTAARFGRGVIRSRARLTYTEVSTLLESPAAAMPTLQTLPEEKLLRDMLLAMGERMRQFNRARMRQGSLDLDLPEALIDLSEEGRSIGLRIAERNDAHRLIEEFMLEANRAVAIRLRESGYALPYRIHEPPDPDDIDALNQFLGPFGFAVDFDEEVRPADIQGLLRRLAGHPLAQVLSRQVLRALSKAKYSTANAGHFGLAFPIYCHFTSPIRRYPDLIVHRQLARLLAGERPEEDELDSIEAVCVQSSQCERTAMEAERAMVDLKKCEFMQSHLHEPCDGTIVSVARFGFFVELDAYPVEGLVRVIDLIDDEYTWIEEEQALKGLRKRSRIRVGDRLRVEAIEVSLRRRQITLGLLERLGSSPAAAEGKRETRQDKRRRERRPQPGKAGKRRDTKPKRKGRR